MIGPDQAARSVASYLRGSFANHLGKLRDALQVSLAVLPDAKVITSADLAEIGIESWPALMVIPERLNTNKMLGSAQDGTPLFDASYAMAIEGYVSAPTAEATGNLNRRYATALRAALTAAPSLRLPDATTPPGAPRVDVESITEEYSPVFDATQGRLVASFRTAFTLRQFEGNDPLRVLDEIASLQLNVSRVGLDQPMPRHPAL